MSIYFEVDGGVVIKHTPISEIGENAYKTEVVMTKDIFRKCYEKWIKPQEITGHWIPLGNYDDYGDESTYKCSECGDLEAYPDNYCPNCGARMESDKE